jgi:uncharacterized membrane protein
MIQVTLYTREDCHLCHQTQADLEALQVEFPHNLSVVDIDSSQELQRRFGIEIPVVEIGPLTLKAPISSAELRQALSAASGLNLPKTHAVQPATRSDRVAAWINRRLVLVLVLLVGLYVGVAFLAPVLMKAGLTTPGAILYRAYGVACHQLAFRSFFLFGPQAEYPRQAAHLTGLETFGQATGLSEGNNQIDLTAARNFLGTPQLGYKLALCERDIALYGAIFIFGLVYLASGRRIPGLPWYLWMAIGILPIALDGFSQLFSQPPFNFLPFRESTPTLRVLTGVLFGAATAWFGFPMIEESLRETR